MTKTKKNPLLHMMPLILFLLLSGAAINTDEPFIENLQAKLSQYNMDYNVEKTYLMTDRFVYRPGEDLWFKGLVAAKDMDSQHTFSEDFFIKLLNSQGEEIVFRRYPLFNNQASGRFMIPKSSIPGKYWLVAYTGWMKNNCPQEAFRKEILISKYFEKRFQVEVQYDRIVYYPHDTLNAVIKILDQAGMPVTETEFGYSIGSFNRTGLKGNAKTDIKGKSKISCQLPLSEEMLMLTIEIRNRKHSGDYSHMIPSLASEPMITFYPEGGNLVVGLKTIMALKAVNNYGLPAMIEGEMIDERGGIMQRIGTGSNGKGKFEYTPSKDTCYLRIAMPDGIYRRIPLPMADETGTVMHLLDSGSDSARFIITSSDDRSRNMYLVGVMGRQIVWSSKIYHHRTTVVNVPSKEIRSGLLQLSLFDEHDGMIAERLVNWNNSSRPLSVKTDHLEYHNRQRVNLLIEYSDLIKVDHLALSVSLNHMAYNAQSTGFYSVIHANPCENASEILANSEPSSDLDLLTTAYRELYWQDVLASNDTKKPYVPYNGLFGRIFDRKDNVSQHAKVRITHFPNYRSYETQTDENGRFQVLFGSDVVDFKYLNIDAYDALGKTSLNAAVDQSYGEALKEEIAGLEENNIKQKAFDLVTYGEPDLVYVLRYGPGKFRKSATESRKKYDPNQYANYTDVMDIIQDIKPYMIRNNKIIFEGEEAGRADSTGTEEAIIVINGALKGSDIELLKNLLPSDITNMNISNSLLDIHKYTPLNFNGVIEITTIQGMYRYRQPHIQVGPNILNAEREFYSPDYAVESTTSADNRRTLYWNPRIELHGGNSLLISFYTSDIKGVFYGHLVGMDSEGNPLENDFTFKVE